MILLFFTFIIFFYTEFCSDDNESKKSLKFKFDVGEELLYDVDYYFIHLGTIKLEVFGFYETKGKKFYKTRVFIKSNPDLPFVKLEQTYESHISEEGYPVYFLATEPEKNYVKFTEYKFDYEKKKLYVLKGKNNPYQIWTDTVGTLNERYQDGLSLFYFARLYSGCDTTILTPTLIAEKRGNAEINFTSNKYKIKNKDENFEFDAHHLYGIANFIGVYGLSGKFEGYFSTDEHSVPIYAKIKVIIGNVEIKLKEWRKNKWIIQN
jgi:hypothetical protein